MAIQIKEFVPSDSLSAAIDKLNYNFDQLILAGGGPEGPQGPQGIIGPAGSKGDKGTQWFYNTVPGTAGTTLPSSIFDGDKIVDSDGQIWEYDGTNWFDTGVNLQGPAGTAGSAGTGGEFLRYIGDGSDSSWAPDANGSQSPIAVGNSQPNFFGYYDADDANRQGIDAYVFGHIGDLAYATNKFGKLSQPRLYVLQSNASNGITIGLGGEDSTSPSSPVIDLSTHAKLFKDLNGKFVIQGSDNGAAASQSEVLVQAINNSRVTVQGGSSFIKLGHSNKTDTSVFGNDIKLYTASQVELRTKGGNGRYTFGTSVDSTNNNYAQEFTVGDFDLGTDVRWEGDSTDLSEFYMTKFMKINMAGPDNNTAPVGLHFKPDRNSLNGIRLQSISGEISDYELFTEIGGIVHGKLLIDSKNLILQSKGNNPTQIGDNQSAHGSNKRYLGMFDSGEDDFRISMGKTKSSGVERYSNIDYHTANGLQLNQFLSGLYMANDNAKSFTFNKHGDYLSIGGKFRSELSSSNYDEVHHAIAITTNRSDFGFKHSSVGFGGIPKASWASEYKAVAHFWGGFRFHGSDPIYNETDFKLRSRKYSSIGYRFKDMLFATRQDLINESTYSGKFDIGTAHKSLADVDTRSKIFIGSRTDTPLSDESRIGYFNIYSGLDDIPQLYFQTDDANVGAEISINELNGGSHSGVSPGNELLIKGYGTHVTIKPGGGASIYLDTDRTINLTAQRSINLETTVDTYSINLTSAEDINITSDDDTVITADYAQFKAKGIWYRGSVTAQSLHTRTSYERLYSYTGGIEELPTSGDVRAASIIRASDANLIIRSDSDHTTEIQRSWKFTGENDRAPRGRRQIFGNVWAWPGWTKFNTSGGFSNYNHTVNYAYGILDDDGNNAAIVKRNNVLSTTNNITWTAGSSVIDSTDAGNNATINSRYGYYITRFVGTGEYVELEIRFADPLSHVPMVNVTAVGSNYYVTNANDAETAQADADAHLYYHVGVLDVSRFGFFIRARRAANSSKLVGSYANNNVVTPSSTDVSLDKLFFSFHIIEPDNDRVDDESVTSIAAFGDPGGDAPTFVGTF